MESPKYLAAFDFDYTVVSQNSDIVAKDLIPASYSIPDDVKKLYHAPHGWTAWMGEVFKILHEVKITEKSIVSAITSIPEVTGMVELIQNLVKLNFEVIIISDSNSKFIESWCKEHGIMECISAVYTNPAKFNENELLTIKPFHKQTTCEMSEMNLCKGMVLEEHIAKNMTNGRSYDKVFYIGDGRNDYCPITKLRSEDFGCARVGYKLENMLAQSNIVKAKTILWKDGIDLLVKIKQKILSI